VHHQSITAAAVEESSENSKAVSPSKRSPTKKSPTKQEALAAKESQE